MEDCRCVNGNEGAAAHLLEELEGYAEEAVEKFIFVLAEDVSEADSAVGGFFEGGFD